MHVLRMAASMLSIGDADPDSLDGASNRKRAARLQAQMPALVAHAYRLKCGKEIVHPKPEHGLAEGFLYMLEGREPDPARVDGSKCCTVAVSEHGLNASTFTGRVVVSTDSDMVSALTAAIGALKGPKHGGVPGPVLKMMEAIGTVDRAEAHIRKEMSEVGASWASAIAFIKSRDPRAALLSDAAEKMAQTTGDRALLDLTMAVEQTTVKVLAELKLAAISTRTSSFSPPLSSMQSTFHRQLLTPIFAAGRTSGWTAHMIEQLEQTTG